MRSEVTSLSNWAKDSRTLSVSRPIEVVVLNCWVTETNDRSVFRGDAGVDGTADGSDRRSLHDRAFASNRSSLSLRPKKRGPFHLVPVIAKATLERLS